MSDHAVQSTEDERRRHFRVDVAVKLAVGPFEHTVTDLRLLQLRERQQVLIRNLRVLQSRSDLVMAEVVEQTIAYLGALMALLQESSSSLEMAQVEASLSEGGIGFVGEPPCGVGDIVPVLIHCEGDPAWNPVEVNAQLVRLQQGVGGEPPFLGFEFRDLTPTARQQLVDIVYCAHRVTIRQGRTA